MTTPTPEYPPTAPPAYTGTFGYPPPQQPAPKKRRIVLILAVAAALLVGIIAVLVGVAVAGGSTPSAQPKPATAWDAEQQAGGPTGEDLADPAPTTAGPTLAASDITLSLKITDKQCFGSAGCNLTARVQAAHEDGVGAFKSDDTWLVTYEITGVEDGPVIGSFEISGGTYTVNEEFLGTKSSKAKPKIKVTSVEKVGI